MTSIHSMLEREFEVNGTTSPLLRLPAELRNQIFNLVLGGMEFLIQSKHDTTREISNNNLKKIECVKKYSDHNVSYRWLDIHMNDDFDIESAYTSPGSNPIDILCVCRKIYDEYSTTIYKLNTFDFAHPLALKIWHAHRTQAQIKSIQTIKVNDDILLFTKNKCLELDPLTTMFPALKMVVMGPYRYEPCAHDDPRWDSEIAKYYRMDAWGDEAAVKKGERGDIEVVFEPIV